MKLSEKNLITIKELLEVEHSAIARKLDFIPSQNNIIDRDLLFRSVGMLDELSRKNNERMKKIVVTCAAILWTYKRENWGGLREFLILILSRIGFAPSTLMIDEEYSKSSLQYKGLRSFINEINITVHQLNCEIFVQDKKYLVTEFQKKVWNKLSKLKVLGISAPTSAGKSFIILLKVIDCILKGNGNVIYIVPTLSLVAQVAADFNKKLKEFNIDNYRVTTTYKSADTDINKIFVLTQEKAISAFSQSDYPYKDISVLVVDEIQNIENVADEGEQRAKTLYDTLIELRHTCNPDLTIISGARVHGLEQLGWEIFNKKQVDEEKTKDSPVASFTYSISKSESNYFFNQYTDILEDPNRIPIVNDQFIRGYGRSQYKDDFLKYLSTFLNNLGTDSRNIIFSPTTTQARKTALKLSNIKSTNDLDSNRIESLIDYIKETVHNDYSLCKVIPKDFVYHHGKTPPHIRSVVEKAVREMLVSNVVCTTTLMQGVNLPAQNVILRNPDLAIRSRGGSKPKLSDYEIANLRGRAGRLLKDFIGRTFVLEEDAFERSDRQVELFPDTEKKLKSGYGAKYKDYEKEIEGALKENIPITDLEKEYGFLITYIRQTVLRYGIDSLERFESVGISISRKQVNSIIKTLESLEVPENVCYKNRYWDPVVLDSIYRARDTYNIPKNVSSRDINEKLEVILSRMSIEYPTYYKRYFNKSESFLESACISTRQWLKEVPLKKILSAPYFDTPKKIEERISLLQNKISYGLPLLLQPIYDIKTDDSMFVKYIEIGAYNSITRKMIELNIPRETSIFLKNNYFTNFTNNSDKYTEELIISKLRQIKDSLGYWRRVQLEGVI